MTKTTSRRAVLAGVSAVAAPSIGVLCPRADDPVYAAIETYKQALAFHQKCLTQADKIEERIFAA